MVDRLDSHFGILGYVIIGFFAASWAVSLAIYRWRGFDNLQIDA